MVVVGCVHLAWYLLTTLLLLLLALLELVVLQVLTLFHLLDGPWCLY
jgi:hypothetical protein